VCCSMKFPSLLVGCLRESWEVSIEFRKADWGSWTVRSSVVMYPDNMNDLLAFGTLSSNSEEIEWTLPKTVQRDPCLGIAADLDRAVASECAHRGIGLGCMFAHMRRGRVVSHRPSERGSTRCTNTDIVFGLSTGMRMPSNRKVPWVADILVE